MPAIGSGAPWPIGSCRATATLGSPASCLGLPAQHLYRG